MPVNLTKPQLIIGGVVALVVVLLGLVLAGVLPGLRGGTGPVSVTGALTVWGLDRSEAIDPSIQSFKAIYPNVTVTYRNFMDTGEYGRALLDALAAGRGPDIFAVENRDVLRDSGKLFPAPAARFTLTQLRQLFPKVVEQDFAPQGSIFGLPLSVDTLALFYNRNLFDRAGVALPPATWEEFQTIVPKFVAIDSKGNITQAAAPLGGSAKTVREAADLLSLLMLQTGTKMVSPDLAGATFDSNEGAQALRFYAQFADPRSSAYTWNDALPSADNLWAAERLAMIFKDSSFIAEMRAKNAFLDYRIAPMPQSGAAKIPVAYPRYWGYGVARQSRAPDLAWQFIVNLTTNASGARQYAVTTRRPPALLALKSSFESDPELGTFANQMLTARSWPQADPDAVRDVFSDMIARAQGHPDQITAILRDAAGQVTQIMSRMRY
ncbi:MAG: extracellular solute-binding protein [Candidatus Jorgensenbacteria bacterium]